MHKPSRPATILDVAAEAKVSKSTVSLVLQGSTLVRDKTAERVRQAARNLGYVYNRRAAELRSQASNIIGVVINDLMNPFFAEILVGLERSLVDAGYMVFMAHTSEDAGRQQQVLNAMREQKVAGIALCPVLGTPAGLVDEFAGWRIPLVVIVRPLGKGDHAYAGSDNAAGVELATRHLLAAGHRKVAFLGGRSGAVMQQRLAGYRRALAASGLRFDPALVFKSLPTREGACAAMSGLLDHHPDVRAAVCYNDLVAFGALSALGERGLRAGRDFAVLGFDNVTAAAHSNPPLSTVDVQPGLLGEQAAALLLQRIREPGSPPRHYLAQPRLVVRQTG